MICTFHSTDHAGFCLMGSTTRIQNHCKVSKVSPFFKLLIGKFISKKNSRSLGPYNTSCHFSLCFPYTPYQRKKCWKIVVVVFLIYDKFFSNVLYTGHFPRRTIHEWRISKVQIYSFSSTRWEWTKRKWMRKKNKEKNKFSSTKWASAV